MLFHAVNPLRIEEFGPYHPSYLIGKSPYADILGLAGIAVIRLHGFLREVSCRRRKPALIAVVTAAAEEIVLIRDHFVECDVDGLEIRGELLIGLFSVAVTAVCVAVDGDEYLGKVLLGLPRARKYCQIHARCICAGACAEDS